MPKRFHLAYFTKFGAPAWRAGTDRLHGDDWWTGDYFADLAQKLEAAKFDLLFFEDGSTVTEFGGTFEADLRNSIYAPQHDPLPLLPVIAKATEHIGVVATASTTLYPPYLLARSLSTIDSLTGGRVGWNIVTSTAGGNYGEEGFPYARRYEIAEEFVHVATELWNSWQPGALVQDADSGVYVDHTKVHAIHHDGEHFRSRGPLNTLRSPQGTPVLAQAGLSPAGRDFAAKHAEIVVVTTTGGVAKMRETRDDMRKRFAAHGRNPDDLKMFFVANLVFTDGTTRTIGETVTDEQARIMQAAFSTLVGVDLSGYALDEPFPQDVAATGHTSILEVMEELGRQGHTLREALISYNYGEGTLDLFGTPEQIADKMAAAMDEVGGDGFFIHATSVATAEYVDKLTNRLIPRLQELGVFRTEYEGTTLREVLNEY